MDVSHEFILSAETQLTLQNNNNDDGVIIIIYVKKLTSLQLCVRTMWWYQSSKPAKIIWVTLDGAMHMASLQADFSW